MDKDTFFLKKLDLYIVATIAILNKNVTFSHVQYAKNNFWKEGIKLCDYLNLLQLWRLIRFFCKERDFQKIKEYQKSIYYINEKQTFIFNLLLDTWYNDKILLQALPEVILQNQNKDIDVNNYIKLLYRRKSPYHNYEK